MDQRFFTDALSTMQSCDKFPDRWAELTKILAHVGLDQVNYAVLNTVSDPRDSAPVTQYSTMDPTWIDYYLEHRLDLDDPHVRFVRAAGWKPYLFDQSLAATLAPEEKSVIDQAADAGLRAQISVVFPDPLQPGAPNGGISIGASCTPAQFRRAVHGSETSLVALVMAFHSLSVGEVRRSQIGADALTPRERSTLSWVANGMRVSRISEKMRVSEPTVELHLRNARRKLRSATTSQAVARALLFGEIAI